MIFRQSFLLYCVLEALRGSPPAPNGVDRSPIAESGIPLRPNVVHRKPMNPISDWFRMIQTSEKSISAAETGEAEDLRGGKRNAFQRTRPLPFCAGTLRRPACACYGHIIPRYRHVVNGFLTFVQNYFFRAKSRTFLKIVPQSFIFYQKSPCIRVDSARFSW